MNNENEFIDADEQECVSYIQNHLPAEYADKITDDDIYFVLDLIDYYQYEMNLADEENDTINEASIAEDDMLNFIMAEVKRDKEVNLSEEQVAEILNCEYDFGVMKGIYIE